MSDETLDIPLTRVAHRVQKRLAAVFRQMRGDQTDCRKRRGAIGEQFEKTREAPCRPCGGDPGIGCRFGEVQHLDAIREKGGTALAEVEPARVEFGKKRDESGRRLSFALSEVGSCGEEFAI